MRQTRVVMALETSVPDSFIIFPLGQVTGEGIEPFAVDQESIRQIQEDLQRKGVDMVIDYEHQSLGEGIAPAAGWIIGFFEKDNALACSVKWTDRARGYIKAGEYRYFSPVAKVDNKGRLVGIHSLALTNLPVGHNLEPLVAMKQQGGREMKQVLNFLGLPDTGTEEDAINAIKGLIGQREQDRQALARTLEMSQTATYGEIIVMAGHLKAAVKSQATPACEEILAELGLAKDAGKSEALALLRVMKQKILTGVSAEEFLIMKKRLAAIETDGMVTLAMSEGKITAAQKEWAEKYATEDPEGFKFFVKNAPVVVIMKQVVTGEGTEKKAREITEEDREVMRQMGVTEEAFRKFNP